MERSSMRDRGISSKGGKRQEGEEPGGRMATKRRRTRARLLEAAYHVMSERGVDAAKIKDITDRADVGFGTFYNYFASKDELASHVLDCLINDFGNRNVAATRAFARKDPALVTPVSMRLSMRAMMTSPLWHWWALRPDLLVDRMREGFGRFALRDIRDAIGRGIFHLDDGHVESAWALAVWVMVAGIHDVVVGDRPPESESFVIESIMRLMGVPPADSRRIASTRLPAYPPPAIDWNFVLGPGVDEPAKS